ncbi:hypothetical protein FB460_1277 [Propioniferax innocua]|uniref:Uncharacterized protein n=1 Tax=Propioniferax innocua TaxID=1753 RepID=A0A542ZSY3_9ACTN|nr:hypothetical protein FB460_1277 [Propioniferax innocua]
MGWPVWGVRPVEGIPWWGIVDGRSGVMVRASPESLGEGVAPIRGGASMRLCGIDKI